MRHLPIWVSLFLLAGPLRAQHPHLDLPPMGSAKRVQLVGQVTDSLSGKPVYDCLVGYYDREGQRRSITPVNSDGRYAMFIPATEPFELRVERETDTWKCTARARLFPSARRSTAWTWCCGPSDGILDLQDGLSRRHMKKAGCPRQPAFPQHFRRVNPSAPVS
ncbi:MAG TPA: hypothetical protein PLV70_06265 [Flavobacteriales bacterium]|nr:hypothetical protein [Flavobacteriales bacterium]